MLSNEILHCNLLTINSYDKWFRKYLKIFRNFFIPFSQKNLLRNKSLIFTVHHNITSMLRNKALLKEQLAAYSKKELVDMLLKLSGKRHNYEYLLVNFLDKNGGEQALYEETIEDIDKLCQKEYKGSTSLKQEVKKLNACVKRINEFCIEAKSKKLEADLVLYVLELQFTNPKDMFGARVSGYDYKVALLIKRLITLVTTKLHPDYLIVS